ncbi:hypothetical protein HDU96_003913 [Phlyctochytrium bullatum]|nr:hypothetical protein HDU96_003913 [Phlyctochytrium bullatum]
MAYEKMRLMRAVPVIQVAKQHLSTLEQLWGEVAGIPISPAELSSGRSSPFAIPSPKNAGPGTSRRLSLGKSFMAQGPNNEGQSSGGSSSPKIDASALLDSLQARTGIEKGLSGNGKVLEPVVKLLEKLVGEEMDRRKQVDDEIKELKMLMDRQALVESLLQEIQQQKAYLEDLESSEFAIDGFEGLSMDAIKLLSGCLDELKLEVSARKSTLLDRVCELSLIYEGLGYLRGANRIPSGCPGQPDEEDYETNQLRLTITALLTELRAQESHGTSLPASVTTLLPVSPDRRRATAAFLFSDDFGSAGRNEIAVAAEEYHSLPPPALQGGSSSTVVASDGALGLVTSRRYLPHPFSLARAYLAGLKATVEASKAEYEDRLRKCRDSIREIEIFWKELEVPEHQRSVMLVEDVKRLDEYQALANELRGRWRQLQEERLLQRLEHLKGLWKRCYISDEDTQRFIDSIADNFFSPLTMERIEEQILLLEERLKREKPVLDMIHDRYVYIQKLKDFEKSASDPQRLFQPSFRLLEEEKFRKTGVPTLLAKEEKLRKAVAAFEAANYPFNFRGERWLEVMDREIDERFVNEALVVFDTAKVKSPLHRQSSLAAAGAHRSSPKPGPHPHPYTQFNHSEKSASHGRASPSLRRVKSSSDRLGERAGFHAKRGEGVPSAASSRPMTPAASTPRAVRSGLAPTTPGSATNGFELSSTTPNGSGIGAGMSVSPNPFPVQTVQRPAGRPLSVAFSSATHVSSLPRPSPAKRASMSIVSTPAAGWAVAGSVPPAAEAQGN